MKVIGLCGGSGSGKGKVSDLFMSYGIPSVDTDEIYHRITESQGECLDALVDAFGKDIISKSGALDRSALRKIVFSAGAEKKRALLNKISHFYVLKKAREIIWQYKEKGTVALLIDAPLLFESGFDKECDTVISVIADEEVRIERIIKRDGITRDDAKKRIAAQLDNEYLLSHSEHNIVNNGDIAFLEEQVRNIVNKILV